MAGRAQRDSAHDLMAVLRRPATLGLIRPGLFVGSAALALVSACSAPAAVRPTLDAVSSLGYTCDEGAPDGEPSGLTEWHCPGTVYGLEGGVAVDGNDAGVAAVSLSVVWPASPDPGIARAAYRRLVEAVPPIDADPALLDALATWNGEHRSMTIGGAKVTAECVQTVCVVTIESAPDP